jgi:hypothetical protein
MLPHELSRCIMSVRALSLFAEDGRDSTMNARLDDVVVTNGMELGS